MTERSHGTPGRADCPDPEQLAAHAEGSLPAAEAKWTDEHIASCAACFDVYAETLRLHLESSETRAADPRVTRPPLWQRPVFRLAAVLVVAAGIAVSLLTLQRKQPHESAQPLVASLAEAMGARRFIEPRVTGGFQHARLVVLRSGEAPQGLDAQTPAVLSAVARIRERAEADTSPDTLGAVAVTYLVSGDLGAAVKALESATAQAPDNARLWSDLAAAYLVRASRLDEPADIPKALEAAERAIALKDPPNEAWFNRALALESLHLDDAARKAWEDYLQRDASSGWADEARQHLEASPKVRQSTVEEDRTRVKAALEQGEGAVDRLADEAPSLLRNYFDDNLLPAWAEAHLVGHPDENLHREHARLLGDALLRVTGDAMARDTAQALITPDPRATSTDPLRAQAQGYRALKEAKRLYDLEEPSCSVVRAGLLDLQAGHTPYAAWGRQMVATSCLVAPEQPEALAELARLHSLAEERGYIQLRGRVRWLQWLLHANRGELTTALERTRAGLESFQRSRDIEAEARMLASIAETLTLLGEDRLAWRERLGALRLLAQVRTPRHRHVLLGDAVLASVDEGLPRAAIQFGTAQLETALAAGRPISISDTLLARASTRVGLGADDLALSDLAESRAWIARISDQRRAERQRAEVDAVEARLLANEKPESAAQAAARALGYFQAAAPQRVPALHLLSARAERARGRDDAAETHLLRGIATLERQRVSLRDAGLQASFFDQALPLFEDMVRMQVTKNHDPEKALEFVERGRARQVLDSLLGARNAGDFETPTPSASAWAPLRPGALRSALPEGLVLVYYMMLEDRLLAWTLTRGGTHFIERSIPMAALAPLVAAHRTALERRSGLVEVQRTAGRLFDELVRPLGHLLAGQRVVVFIPEGALQSLSFASLWDRETGRWLVEDFLLGIAPSGTAFVRASALAARAPRSQGLRVLVVGNPLFDRRTWANLPPLPGAEAEAAEVASLYPGAELLTAAAATKAAFLREVRRSEVVHFAGHASGRFDTPSSLRLLLAADVSRGDSGALFLQDLEQRAFPRTRVVVLAACRTAAGSGSRLEGALSLGRPFLGAGVPNVVGSLWDIDDALSRRFFVTFHRALRAGAPPASAVREAQMTLLRDRDPSLSHPTSWAAFVSMGGYASPLLPKGVLS